MANGGNGEGGFQRSPNTYSGDRGGPAEDEALLAELRAISMKSGRSRFAEGTTNDDDDGNGNGNGDADEIAEIGGVATRGGGDRTAPRSTAAADEGFCAVARNCDDELGGGEIAPLEKGNETPDIPDGSARHDGDRADDDIADAPSLERIDGLIIEGGGGVHRFSHCMVWRGRDGGGGGIADRREQKAEGKQQRIIQKQREQNNKNKQERREEQIRKEGKNSKQ